MKKNKMMRAAAGVMVATLITTSAFSGAMAKYVVSDNATDTARVAKFGVVASVTGNLFGSSYGKDDLIQAWEGKTHETVAASDAATTLVVAPGTKNDKGMTFTVKGTPEVSTKLTVDAPEVENKDYVNTDIVLKSGAYSIMAKVEADKAAITVDNMANYYTLNPDGETFAVLNALPAAGAMVYKKIPLTTADGDAKMSADYYPIKWKVGDAEKNNVADVLAAVKTGLAGADSGTATHKPNEAWNGTATVTWSWAFGEAWADGAADATLLNWENTALTDLEDTVLGQMIALAKDGSPDTYEIAKDNALVHYAYVDAAAGSANKVDVAYIGADAPTLATDGAVTACLTASFGARVTVEQVDNPAATPAPTPDPVTP